MIRLRGRALSGGAVCIGLLLSACSASTSVLPDTTDLQPGQMTNGAQVAEPAAAQGAGPAVVAGAGSNVIVGFKRPTIVLYGSPTSNNGERVPARTVATPLKPRVSANASRVEIMTVDGPRWISKSDIIFGPAT